MSKSKKIICKMCGKEFIGRLDRKYCSRDCANKDIDRKRKKSQTTRKFDPITRKYIVVKKEKNEETVLRDCKHKDCIYRGGTENYIPTCDYLLMTGKQRNCKISKCNKYKSKKR